MDYATLDGIADSYIPLLACFSLAAMIFISSDTQSRVRSVFFRAVLVSILLAVAYGLMLLDTIYFLWPGVGLDYSTHTAVSLVLILFLVLLTPRLLPLWLSSLISYYSLMIYQKYHSLSDIISTALAIAVVLSILFLPILFWVKPDRIRRSDRLDAMFPLLRRWSISTIRK